jgi:hypothetical protein
MTDNDGCLLTARTRTPWNKGKLTGAKPPLRPEHVWAIRTRADDPGADPRSSHVQRRDRQQVARLRCGGPNGGRHCSEWLRDRPSNG